MHHLHKGMLWKTTRLHLDDIRSISHIPRLSTFQPGGFSSSWLPVRILYHITMTGRILAELSSRVIEPRPDFITRTAKWMCRIWRRRVARPCRTIKGTFKVKRRFHRKRPTFASTRYNITNSEMRAHRITSDYTKLNVNNIIIPINYTYSQRYDTIN